MPFGRGEIVPRGCSSLPGPWVYNRPNKLPWRARFCPSMREAANGVTYTASDIGASDIWDGTRWYAEISRDMSRNEEREAFLKYAILMNIFKAKQNWSPIVRQSTKMPDFKSQKGEDMWLSVYRICSIQIYIFGRLLKTQKSESRRSGKTKRKGELRGNKERFQGLLCCFRFVSFTICQSRNFPSVGSK